LDKAKDTFQSLTDERTGRQASGRCDCSKASFFVWLKRQCDRHIHFHYAPIAQDTLYAALGKKAYGPRMNTNERESENALVRSYGFA
jgi:hypothetical protein